MTRDEIFSVLRDLLVEVLNVEPEDVTKDASFVDDLGADEIDITEVGLAVEEEFAIAISDLEAENFKTVGELINIIEENL